MPTHANYLSTYLSILTSCHVTCDTRPSASLHVPNEAGRSGDEAILGQNRSTSSRQTGGVGKSGRERKMGRERYPIRTWPCRINFSVGYLVMWKLEQNGSACGKSEIALKSASTYLYTTTFSLHLILRDTCTISTYCLYRSPLFQKQLDPSKNLKDKQNSIRHVTIM